MSIITDYYFTQELDFEFHYFIIRKFWFLYLAKALIINPSGFGTMDKLFEMLTLLQTRKTNNYIPIGLFGPEFWKDIINFENLIKWKIIILNNPGFIPIEVFTE